MNRTEAFDEYARALRAGQREYKERVSEGLDPYPKVLNQIIADMSTATTQRVGLLEIPADQIVGTCSAGRIWAFTAGFRPLLEENSEFAHKWVALCVAHLSDEGIRDPVECYEYLGEFYIQEGNKRISVLKHFGATRIPANVIRILPKQDDTPQIRAYYEFLDFYHKTRLYSVRYRRPGDYQRLLSALGKDPTEDWTEQERLTFTAYLQYFRDAFDALNGSALTLRPEEALLLWLQVYPFRDLGRLSGDELKKTLTSIWEDLTSLSQPDPVLVETATPKAKGGILGRIISTGPEHLNIAFIHQLDIQQSGWIRSHDEGRQYLEEVMGNAVTTQSFFNVTDTQAAIETAIEDGAQVIFTTSPQMSRDTLKAAVKNPKVRFLNCSVDMPYSSIRTYYSRVYEGKFITGAIAGAMAGDDEIGYIASYPIFGEPASINAFALGAQLTNPRATVKLRWSCLPGTPVADLISRGVRVISNREMPSQDQSYLDFCTYGTYQLDEFGSLSPLGSPVWMWGRFYENVIRSIMSGAWDNSKDKSRAVNYWWGMDSGVVDVRLSDKLPEGVRLLAELLRKGLQTGTVDPFFRTIHSQDGTLRNDGSRTLTPDEILHMDWLCDNVEGQIPSFDQILPISRGMVRTLGIYRDSIPAEKEAPL